MPRIVVLGEALIDLLAQPGRGLADTPSLRPSPGGAPANVAVALGRLGAEVGFIGKVGRDAFGEWLQTTLAQARVDTLYFQADPRAPTMLGVVARPRPDEQQFILYNAANSLLEANELPTAYIQGAAVFVYGSVTLASHSREAALKAAWLSRAAGGQVIFDVNLRPALWPDLQAPRQQIEAALKTATVVKANQGELEFLSRTHNLESGCEYLLEQGIQLCCISLGEQGAYFANRQASGRVEAFRVEVKDTTGCGDGFVAGLALKLSELQRPPETLSAPELHSILRFANACGAVVATQEGAMAHLDRRVVEAMVLS